MSNHKHKGCFESFQQYVGCMLFLGVRSIFFGHVKCGQGQKALEEGGVETDPVTFVGLLNACASVATLERRQVS